MIGVKFSAARGAVPLAWAMTACWAFADDLIPPDWRGDPGTTYEECTFDDDDNPAAPEIVNNPYGTASATIVVHEYGAGWGASRHGRDNVWADLESITIDIDNRWLPVDYKEIWIQITYYMPPNSEPTVDVPDAVCLGGETLELETFVLGRWYLQQSVWGIEPSPDHEVIEITASSTAMTIDQIVIDTKTEPPPPTCNDPFADADGDGDVDQEDFGSWQVCSTGPDGGMLAGCECFDRDNNGAGDGDVDLDDLDAFEACASGPGIPANDTCDE